MSQVPIETKLAELLKGLNIYFSPKVIGPRDDLFSLGALDSLSLIQFVVSIEDFYRVNIQNADITFTNFATLAGIAQMLHEKYKI